MNVLDAVTSKGITMKRMSNSQKRGVEFWGACPSCGGNDRFHVWPDERNGEGSYWCRSCGKAGDLVQFFVDFQGMTFPDAFKAAGRDPKPESEWKNHNGSNNFKDGRNNKDKYSNQTAISQGKPEFVPAHYDMPCETWQIKAQKLVDYAHGQLLKNPEQIKILAERGLDIEAIKAFRLGFLAGEDGKNAIYRPREQWGLPEILKDDGKKKKLWIPRGLTIPYFQKDKDGVERIARVRIRRPQEDRIKSTDVPYYILPGSSMEAMLIYSERKAFVIVESELDAMLIARQAGMMVGALALGSVAVKPGRESFHNLKKSLSILVALDVDEAGKKACKWWTEEFSQAKRYPVSEGKDPGEFFQKDGDVFTWVLAGVPPAISLKFKNGWEASTKPEYHNIEQEYPADMLEILAMEHEQSNPVELLNENHFDSGLPNGVGQLKTLLDRYPVKIKATPTQTKIVFSPNFENESVLQQVSNLVYWDVDVWDFLENHPADFIHRDNFMYGISNINREPMAEVA